MFSFHIQIFWRPEYILALLLAVFVVAVIVVVIVVILF